MTFPSREDNERLSTELVTFAKEEQERRRRAAVLITAEDVQAQLKDYSHILIADPRTGSNQKSFRFWIQHNRVGVAMEGGGWKTLGHRHTVEAVIYIVQGHGYSVIDGAKYPWQAGDLLCVPVFGWHRHVNESEQDHIYLAATTGPLSMYMGTAIYEDERYPEHWVYAQEGEAAMRTLIPGSTEAQANQRIDFDPSRWQPGPQSGWDGPSPAELYYDQLTFAQEEERQRRAGRVLVKGNEARFGPTPMGSMAYLVDPRVGFHVKLLSTLFAEVPAGKHSGAHRHLYEETDHVLSGAGYAIVEDRRYDFKKGDSLIIPVFAWHQYFNTGPETVRFLVHTNRPAMENTGYLHTQQGEPADY